MSKNRDLANNYDNSVVDAKLNKADNLSDLPNIVTARTNLGLSTGATGTVTTSKTDTTAGRLLKVGDFGIGNQKPEITDLNIAPSGYSLCTSASLNIPEGVAFSGGVSVFTWKAEALTGGAFQELVGRIGSINRIFRRNYGGTTWSAWREIYHQGNILGTVSQTAGVPTGAIIQRGSNSNGEFVRYADGTQICTNIIVVGSVVVHGSGTFTDPYTSEVLSWGYPLAFSSAPAISGFGYRGNATTERGRNRYIVSCGHVTTTVVSYIEFMRVGNNTNVHGNESVSLIAIGRWF